MTITEQLDKLFDIWVRRFPKYKDTFVADGIIDEEVFIRQNLKVLFIAKEPNDPEQEGGDFRTWWREEVKYSFSHRICEWAYGLLNHFPPIEKLPYENNQRIRIMRSIAFMNLKKNGGGANADHDTIQSVVETEREFILEEISIIKPNLIIGCVGHTRIWDILFPGIKFLKSGFDIKVARFSSYKFIDFYHPSYRVPRAMSYCLLGRVFDSIVFKKL